MKPLTMYIAASKGVGRPFVGWCVLICDGLTGDRIRMMSDGLVNSDLRTGRLKAMIEGLKTLRSPSRLRVVTTDETFFNLLKDNCIGLRSWEAAGFRDSSRPGLWRIVFEHSLRHDMAVTLLAKESDNPVLMECFVAAKKERRDLQGAPARRKYGKAKDQ